jgi:hypothetical protein
MYLGHNHNLVTRKLELLDSLAQDLLRLSVGVDVRGVERLDACIITTGLGYKGA